MALVRVTGRYESTLPAGFPGFRKGTIVPLFHARGTIPRDKDLLNVGWGPSGLTSVAAGGPHCARRPGRMLGDTS